MISTSITEGANVFTGTAAIIKEVAAPLSVHVFGLVWQQLIYLLHDAVVLVVVVAFTKVLVAPATLLFVPGLFLVLLNLTWMVLLLGTLGARFRHVPPIVASFTATLFIVTPVMWPITLLPEGHIWVAYTNPLTYLIDVIRLPTLGTYPDLGIWLICIARAVVGWTLAFWAYARARTRLAYWL